MMSQTMEKLYDTFSPAERLTLFLQALDRGDEAEAQRLWRSCPRRTYEQADAAFADRHQVAFDTAAVMAADLRHLCGRVRALHWARGLIEVLTTHGTVIAGMAFEEGIALAEGRPRGRFFLPQEKRKAKVKELADPEPEKSKRRRREAYAIEELADRSLGVEERARQQGERVMAILVEGEREAAGQLAVGWAAFGRFCRERVGVEPQVLLGAWSLTVHEEVEDLLRECPHEEPKGEQVERFLKALGVLWDRRVG